MAVDNNHRNKSKYLSVKDEGRRDIYISYNTLSQRGEEKSVSQAMHEYIKNGFAKFSTKKV